VPHLTVTDESGVAVVRLTKPPANTMDPAFLDEGARVVEELRVTAPDAVVLIGQDRFFSGGFDLNSVPLLSPSEQRDMIHGANRAFADWYGFPRPVIAAINGHAVAGGLILALCGDERLAVSQAKLGLTEVKVGIPYPIAAIEIVKAEVPRPMIRRLVLGGQLIDPDEAHRGGVVDEIVDDDALLDRALERARALAAHPRRAYETIKAELRADALRTIETTADRDPLASGWLSDETSKAAAATLERDR